MNRTFCFRVCVMFATALVGGIICHHKLHLGVVVTALAAVCSAMLALAYLNVRELSWFNGLTSGLPMLLFLAANCVLLMKVTPPLDKPMQRALMMLPCCVMAAAGGLYIVDMFAAMFKFYSPNDHTKTPN